MTPTDREKQIHAMQVVLMRKVMRYGYDSHEAKIIRIVLEAAYRCKARREELLNESAAALHPGNPI